MNESRMQSILANMSSQHTKVYDATPIQEAWTTSQVYAEMRRNHCSTPFANVERMLNDLADQGLLVKSGGRFQRWTPKERPTLTLHTNKEPETVPTPTAPADPIEQLAAMANKLRADATALMERADALDTIAIQTSEAIAEAGKSSGVVEQLRKLLRD